MIKSAIESKTKRNEIIPENGLEFAIKHGIIDLGDVLNKIEHVKKQEILDQHPFQIWQATDNRWKTYLSDNGEKGRKLIAKATKEKLEKEIVKFYKDKEEKEKIYTFQDLYDIWYKYKANKVKKQSLERYDVDYKKFYTTASFLNKDIKEIDILEIEEWLQEQIVNFKLKKTAYYNMQSIVKQPLEYAYKKKLLAENLWDFIDISTLLLTQSEKPDSESQVFNKQERALMVEQAWKDYHHNPNYIIPLMFLLTDQTGIRNGELTALKPSDMRVNGKLMIQRQEVKYHDENNILVRTVEETTKTDATKRELYLSEKAKEIVSYIPVSGTYLFEKENERITTSMTDAYIRRLCRKVGIPVRGMHKVRKTFISNLFAVGLHPEQIRIISGHDDLRTLFKSYCFCIETQEEIISKINAAS